MRRRKNTPEMVMHSVPPHQEALELSRGNILAYWKNFKQKYITYEIATEVSSKDGPE